MRAGKLPPADLERLVLGRLKRRRSDVLVPAALGEDSVVVDFGAEVCVLSTDPITGAGEGAGRLAVHVSCNDIAANGATPVGVQVVLLLPEDTDPSAIASLMDEVEQGCAELQIEVLGGHTETTSRVLAPVVVATALGRAPKNRYVTSGGARAGDAVVVTKGVGLEGTAILATDWASVIRRKAEEGLGAADEPGALDEVLARARAFSAEISAVRDGWAAAEFGVSAMHDVTEGGLYGALYEMGRASDVSFCITEADVPVRPETRLISGYLGLDPLGLISSGTMLITCPDGPGLVRHLAEAGVSAYIIGRVCAGEISTLIREGSPRPLPVLAEDELWRFLAQQE